MTVDRERFIREGFLVRRQVVPAGELEALRTSYETLIERQGGRQWQAGKANPPEQPRLTTGTLVDESTANAAEVWLHENTLGVSRQLCCLPQVTAVWAMWMMCNPLTDHGPAHWHRDIHPIDMAPMCVLQRDFLENGPRYLQWNIALHDDDVLWVVPGSHRRANTPQENRQLLENNRVPLPDSVPVRLRAGDGVVYTNFILHWGSNYSPKLRRTLHGGYCIFTLDADCGCAQLLSPSTRALFEQFARQTARMQDATESALRAVISNDAAAFDQALQTLQPGIGQAGKLVLAIYLCKAVCFICAANGPDRPDLPADFLRRGRESHAITLNWGPSFAHRFSQRESNILWQRFQWLDQQLQADQDQFTPGYDAVPMRYYIEDVPSSLSVDDFIASWQ